MSALVVDRERPRRLLPGALVLGGLPRRRFGRPVGRDHDAGGRRLDVDEPESGEGTAVREEAAPRSENQRVDREHVLVDEVASHQRLSKLSAAQDNEILYGCLPLGVKACTL